MDYDLMEPRDPVWCCRILYSLDGIVGIIYCCTSMYIERRMGGRVRVGVRGWQQFEPPLLVSRLHEFLEDSNPDSMA